MRRVSIGLLLTVVLLVFAGSAMAGEINLLPQDQIGVVLPRGMAEGENVTVTKADGKLDILIMDGSVGWADAFASTGLNGSNVQIIWQVKAPADIKDAYSGETDYYHLIRHENISDTDALTIFAEDEAKQERYQKIGSIDGWGVPCNPGDTSLPMDKWFMPMTENGSVVATSIPELDYVVPVDYQRTVYVGWYDQNKNLLSDYGYQKLTITIRHQIKEPFEDEVFNEAKDEDIIGNAGSADDVKVLEKQDGAICYLASHSVDSVKTKIRPTKNGVTQFALAGNMKSGGVFNPRALTPDGCAVIDTVIFDEFDAHTYTTTVFFCDADGKVLENVSVNISYQTEEELMVWAAYSDDMYPVYAEQLVIDNQAAGSGYTAVYDEATGHLSCGFDGTKKDGSVPGTVMLSVKQPPWGGVVGYRVYEASNNTLFGANAGSLAGVKHELDMGYPNGPETNVSDLVYRDRYSAFNIVRPADDSITIYVPAVPSVDHLAKLFVVEWINDDGSIDYQYFWQTTEPFVAYEVGMKVESEKNMKKPIDKPCFVIGNNPYQNWELKVTYYTTRAEDSWHVDLALVDENGKPVHKVTKPIRIYLPYPDEHGYGNKDVIYKVKHYSDDLYNGKNGSSFETLEALATEYGLMFETTSFSPFILSWEEETAGAGPETTSPAQPPKTGDTALPELWMALGALSACLMLLIGKRKTA